GDFDGDGDMDYVLTNLGLNTKYSASVEHPYIAYYGDFEGKGRSCFVEALFEDKVLLPVRGKSCSTHAMPHLAQRFTNFHTFASATLEEIYSSAKLGQADKLEVNTLQGGVLINHGDFKFVFEPLPRLAQISPGFGVVTTDADADGFTDILMVQNSYAPQPETGRMAGGVGLLLRGDGRGSFTPVRPDESGFLVPGDAKALTTTDLNGDGWVDLVATRNNATPVAFRNRGGEGNRPIGIFLTGPKGNPHSIGAKVTVTLDSGRTMTAELYAGGGYLSQSSPRLFFGRKASEKMTGIEVRWPDGQPNAYEPEGTEILLNLSPD
ncbi:MAG: CRTAC1 family protein, partial [Verrucomicrobiota bacterium]